MSGSAGLFCCQNRVQWYHSDMLVKVAIYARQSPDYSLSAEDQVEHLKAVAAKHGWTVCDVFTDRPEERQAAG
jgi:hypothetical protein